MTVHQEGTYLYESIYIYIYKFFNFFRCCSNCLLKSQLRNLEPCNTTITGKGPWHAGSHAYLGENGKNINQTWEPNQFESWTFVTERFFRMLKSEDTSCEWNPAIIYKLFVLGIILALSSFENQKVDKYSYIPWFNPSPNLMPFNFFDSRQKSHHLHPLHIQGSIRAFSTIPPFWWTEVRLPSILLQMKALSICPWQLPWL